MFYGREEIRKELSEKLENGECVYINGPNGIGKTELIKWFINKEDKQPWNGITGQSASAEEVGSRYLEEKRCSPDWEKKRVVAYIPDVKSGMDSILLGLRLKESFENREGKSLSKEEKSKLKEIKKELDNATNRDATQFAEKIMELYSELEVRQLVLFVDEFENISSLTEEKKEQLLVFLDELKKQGERKEIRVSLVLASRKSLEVLCDKDSTFGKNFGKTWSLSGFIDTELEEIYSNEFRGFTQEVMREVYFYCGRHPGLLKNMRRELPRTMAEKVKAEDVSGLIQKEKYFTDTYQTFYKKMQDETDENGNGPVSMFLDLFDKDRKNLTEEERDSYAIQLVWKGFIVEAFEEGDKAYIDSFHGIYKLGMGLKDSKLNVRYKEYEPVTPYMLEYIKTKAEEDRVKYEIAASDELESKTGIIEVDTEPEVLPAPTTITLTVEALEALKEEQRELGATLGYSKGKYEGYIDGQEKGHKQATEIYREQLEQLIQAELERKKLDNGLIDQFANHIRTMAEDMLKTKSLTVEEQIRQATWERQKEYDELSEKLVKAISKLENQEAGLSEEERKKLEEEKKELAQKLQETEEKLEKERQEAAEKIENAWKTRIESKYKEIFDKELDVEKIRGIFLATKCNWVCSADKSKIARAVRLLALYGFERDLKLTVFIHELFNDLSDFVELDYSVLTMLYSKIYEGFLKKLHMPVYKTKLPNFKVGIGTLTFSNAALNQITIGSFSYLFKPESSSELATLKTMNPGNCLCTANEWDTVWTRHKECVTWMKEIRNGVMHPKNEAAGTAGAAPRVITLNNLTKNQLEQILPEQRLVKLLQLLFEKEAFVSIAKIREAFEFQNTETVQISRTETVELVQTALQKADTIISKVTELQAAAVYTDGEAHLYKSGWTSRKYQDGPEHLFIRNYLLPGKNETFPVVVEAKKAIVNGNVYANFRLGLFEKTVNGQELKYYALNREDQCSTAEEKLGVLWEQYKAEEAAQSPA